MIIAKKKLEYGLPLAILLLVTAGILQDLLASVLLDRGFVISESLLFKTVWVIFLPFTFYLWYGHKKKQLFLTNWPYPLVSLCLTVGHLLLSSLLISAIARGVMLLPFTFSGILKYLTAHQGPVILLVYVLLPILIRYLQREKPEHRTDVSTTVTYSDHIPVRQGRRVISVPVEAILCIRAETPYSRLLTANGQYLTNNNLKQWQEQLDPEFMVRIHRSTIVNVKMIRELKSRANGDYDVLLENDLCLRWSRNYPERLKALLHLGQ